MADKQVVFITGANTGIGYEIAKALYASSSAYEILLGSRKVDAGDAAIAKLKGEVASSSSSVSVVQIDVVSDNSIHKAVEHISNQYGRLDCLINNAGAGFDGKIQTGRMGIREAFAASWDVNVTGAHVLTHESVPLLLKSSSPRLLFMTSGTSALSETERLDWPPLARLNASPEAGWPKPASMNPVTSYRSTKTGLNMLMREWAKMLKNDGVKVWAISPGFLATNLSGIGAENLRKMGARDPSEGGNFVRDVVEGKRDDQEGKAIRVNMIQPW